MPQQIHLLGFQVDVQEGGDDTTLLILTDTGSPLQYVLPLPKELATEVGRTLTAPTVATPPAAKLVIP